MKIRLDVVNIKSLVGGRLVQVTVDIASCLELLLLDSDGFSQTSCSAKRTSCRFFQVYVQS